MGRWNLSTWDRFWSKVDVTAFCWNWLGSSRASHQRRYGTFWYEDRKIGAHRMVWFLMYGEWPDVIDHMCGNTLCVNPLHLRNVTHQINILAGTAPSAIAARTGVCSKGHSDWKTIRATGKKRCAECERIRARRDYSRKRSLDAGGN
jgi:hypothetical protein